MGLLLADSAWYWNWWGLSYLCCDSGGKVEFEETRTAVGLDLLQPRLGKLPSYKATR